MTQQEAKHCRRQWWRRKRVWIPLPVLLVLLLVVGPWPTYSDSYEGSDYAQETLDSAERAEFDLAKGPLQVGVGTVEITPRTGEPLAGYGGRPGGGAEAPLDVLRAEAITLQVGRRRVTFVGGDILLFLPELRQAVLERTSLPAGDVLFTATHTHAGPGGYAPGWIHQFVVGTYDRRIAERLANAFAAAICRSIDSLEPAAVRTQIVTPSPKSAQTYCLNRIEPGGRPHGTLALAVFESANGNDPNALASLVVASPHPTCHSSSNRHPTADYPGVVKRRLEKALGGTCLFAVGATGSMRATKRAPKGLERARDVGLSIVAALESAGALDPNEPPRRETTIGSSRVDVHLPPLQYRVAEGYRISPHLAGLAHDRKTYVQAVRVGELVFLGMPADCSGELAMDLERTFGDGLLRPVVTSFNGDYIGYVVPHRRYALDHYETRDMNFFGPWCGEYLNAIAARLVRRAAQRAER